MKQDSRKPLYSIVQEYIRDRIRQGLLKPGEKIPTEHELKDKFNVSRMTISTAMIHLTKEGLIRRIPGKGTFVMDELHSEENINADGGLRPAEGDSLSSAAGSGKIGLIMPSVDSLFAMRIVDSVHRTLIERNFELVMGFSNNSKKQEQNVIRELFQLKVDGLIIFPVDEDSYNDSILSLKLSGFPLVLIDRYLPGVETNFAGIDNQQGARLAVSHLWELGHREIAVCSAIDFPSVTIRDRLDGYVKEMMARGALIKQSLMLSDIDIRGASFDSGHPLYRYIKSRQATAYLALHPSVAILIHNAAKEIGLRIPEELSIISFDNPTSLHEEFAYFSYIDQNEQIVGKSAAEIIMDLLARPSNAEERENTRYRKVILEPTLHVNRTTASKDGDRSQSL